MNTITIEQIKTLGNIPETLHNTFLRVANGLMERAEYPPEKVMTLFAMMLGNYRKYAYSKNKTTNLAKKYTTYK